jgi:RND family efflux transporter MFP subunit
MTRQAALSPRLRRAAALIGVVLLGGCDEPAGNVAAADDRPRAVKLTTVETDDGIIRRRFVGRVEALRTVDLAFELTGQVVDLPVVTGEAVAEGSLIAALDRTDFELRLREAEARRDLARLTFRRADDLVSRGAAPQAQRDEAEAEMLLAEVGYDQATRALAQTEITAPFPALITRRHVDAYAFVTPGTPIVRVQDVSEMRVAISVPESLVGLAPEPGTLTARARLAALPGETFPLALREFVTEADPVAQTYEVSFAIDGSRDSRILPGMTATVEIDVQTGAPQGLQIPLAAVDGSGPEGPRVWVFDAESGTVSARAVTLGTPREETVPVLDGLETGLRIVAAGADRLLEGQEVRPASF